jgi:hypothetical protein
MLHRLVAIGQLPTLIDVEEWRVPEDESVSCPLRGYIISFVAFHECGFSIPTGRFIRDVLYEYRLQL